MSLSDKKISLSDTKKAADFTSPLAAGAAGFSAGVASDQLARSPYAPPFMSYENATGPLAQWSRDHPIAAPITRGLAAAIPLALIVAAMREGRKITDWDQLSPKYASPKTDEDKFWGYLFDNFDAIEKEAHSILTNYMSGFTKACKDHNVDSQELMKQAQSFVAPGGQQGYMMPQQAAQQGAQAAPQQGFFERMGPLGTALDIGTYFIPGVGTVRMGADALNDFKNMFGADKTWKQRLLSGLSGVANTAFAGLSLVPGLGLVGGGLRAGAKGTGMLGKLIRHTPFLGKSRGARKAIGRAGDAMLGAGQRLAGGMAGAATQPGALGATLRYMGYNPATAGGAARLQRMQNAAQAGTGQALLRTPMYPGLKGGLTLAAPGIANAMIYGDPSQAVTQPLKQYATVNPYIMAGATPYAQYAPYAR
jgi:hypothetical protein